MVSGGDKRYIKSIATWNPWTGVWKSDQLHMVLLRVGDGEAWKLQKGELGNFSRGSSKASKRGVWRLRFPKGVGISGVIWLVISAL